MAVQPIPQERPMRENEFIVSKTDRRGVITYCNRIFIEFSGYSEAELLGAPHKIIRHPEMPRGVFHLLWQTLAQGRECFAYVKNMAKDGSYYWVFANITPDIDERGEIAGYFSVRRKPRREAIATIEEIYAGMRAEEARSDSRNAPAASMNWLAARLAEQRTTYEEFILSI